ncbi:hypothetical protein B0H14DRAFT_2597949 [Mycena olivaceomarginata]|nr:hypothetical protein B0H14DRAFT_2597949 [Mycena olivaceomarginata]
MAKDWMRVLWSRTGPAVVCVSASFLLKLYVIQGMAACLVIWASSGIFLVLLDGLEDARTDATFAFQATLLPFSLSSCIVASRMVFLVVNFFCSIFEPLLRFVAISSGD